MDAISVGAVIAVAMEAYEKGLLSNDYYKLRGWNPDGSPGEERLAELGLA